MLRKEDPRLLTGEARFVDDLVIPGALWLAMVRSPEAHARIRSIDTSARAGHARRAGRAHAARTSPATGQAPMPCAWPVTEDMKNPHHRPVAVGKVSYVGDIVAVVVAETRYQAADAVDAVVVDYETLPAVVDLEDALADTTVIHDDLGTNSSYTWELCPDKDAVDAAFAVGDPHGARALRAAAAHPGGAWSREASSSCRRPTTATSPSTRRRRSPTS